MKPWRKQFGIWVPDRSLSDERGFINAGAVGMIAGSRRRSSGGAVPSTPVAYWKLDETSGTTTTEDSSGNGWTGTLNNFTGNPWTTGHKNNCLTFASASSQWVSVSGSLIQSWSYISVGMWVKTASLTTTMTVFSKLPRADNSSAADPYQIVLVAVQADGKIYWILSSGASGSRKILSTAGAISTGVWQHIACTYDGSTMRAYINGSVDSNTTAASLTVASSNNTYPVHIGAQKITAPDQGYWNGDIDEVVLYDRSLSSSEVTTLKDNT